MIDEATKDMDSIEANHWFCIEAQHTVFQRERDFLDTSEAPYERYLILTLFSLLSFSYNFNLSRQGRNAEGITG